MLLTQYMCQTVTNYYCMHFFLYIRPSSVLVSMFSSIDRPEFASLVMDRYFSWVCNSNLSALTGEWMWIQLKWWTHVLTPWWLKDHQFFDRIECNALLCCRAVIWSYLFIIPCILIRQPEYTTILKLFKKCICM